MVQKTPIPDAELKKLKQKINDKPSLLLAVIKNRLHTPGYLQAVHVNFIDPYGGYLTFRTSSMPTTSTKIHFDPPAKSGVEMEKRWDGWVSEAKEAYKIPEQTRLDYYQAPSTNQALPPILGLLFLFWTYLSPDIYATQFRRLLEEKVGAWLLPSAVAFAAFAHLFFEPLLMLRRLYTHQVPFFAAVKWILTVVPTGYGAFVAFNQCLEHERLRWIYKLTDVGDVGPRSNFLDKEKKKQ